MTLLTIVRAHDKLPEKNQSVADTLPFLAFCLPFLPATKNRFLVVLQLVEVVFCSAAGAKSPMRTGEAGDPLLSHRPSLDFGDEERVDLRGGKDTS